MRERKLSLDNEFDHRNDYRIKRTDNEGSEGDFARKGKTTEEVWLIGFCGKIPQRAFAIEFVSWNN